MRIFLGVVLSFLSWGVASNVPVSAQEFIGETGACTIETVHSETVTMNSCKRMPPKCSPKCSPTSCRTSFVWQHGGTATVIELPSAEAKVADGLSMNGQNAYAPAALQDSDPRDCIYNSVSDAVFCWVAGSDAFTLAAGGLGDAAALRVIARMALDTKSNNDIGPILSRLQGRYIPFPTWDCTVLGGEGGAIQIKGNVFYGVESACTLTNERSVGVHGAALFDVSCKGEGETWQDAYIFKLDEWGRLGWMSADQVSTLEACQ